MTTIASLDELVRLVEADPDLFLRYSPGRTRTHWAGRVAMRAAGDPWCSAAR